ncbi:thyroid stimulating hormone subunit beta a [Platichthys flesus]|uniref:thyroid stimulating hormone subunit beta a n=1 Tax=Platichthys flesus TaxID=8260 RepID=UPI002DB5FEEC|nr:thyroid stimulating hormone subunit beta a [Platichthys flesus]XP_062262623.1 thyroid stimulating hormone subunit beta a [Platichthys flesus]
METAVFNCWLLFLLFSPTVPMCLPTDFTLYVEKPECDFCVAINTTSCMGFCKSWERNLRDSFGPRVVQRGCTYDEVTYRTVVLPGCPVNTNPLFTYPVALSCHCSTCRTDSDECARRATADRPRCTKPVRHVYPYPGPSDYMIPL